METPKPSDAAIAEAERVRSYYPFRRIWIVVAEDGTHEIIAKSTAHVANAAMRAGKNVFELVVARPMPHHA